MELERKVVRVLTEFNFDFYSKNELDKTFKEYAKYLTNEKLREYFNLGWREKMIFSFFVAFNNKVELIELIESDLIHDINGRHIKCYLLAIILLSNNDKKKIFMDLLGNPSIFENQKCWVESALKYIEKDVHVVGENCLINYEKFNLAMNFINDKNL